MFPQVSVRFERWLALALASGLVLWLMSPPSPGKAAQNPATVGWEYRELEVEPSSIQATLEDLGTDHWEVFDVYPACNLINEGGTLRLDPHTFYVFAKRPAER